MKERDMLSNVINDKRLCLITAVDCGFIMKGEKRTFSPETRESRKSLQERNAIFLSDTKQDPLERRN